MKILMLGWEFPPYISGGLGVACHGLCEALGRMGMEILFILPHGILSNIGGSLQYTKQQRLKNVRFRSLGINLYPYANPGSKILPAGTCPGAKIIPRSPGMHYESDLFGQVKNYTDIVCKIAQEEEFDIIHAHDWMTFPAAIRLAQLCQKPLVVHIHSTEKDRSGDHVNQQIYDIERAGMHRATRVITVSRYTSRICQNDYGIACSKISIVYNSVRHSDHYQHRDQQNQQKTVLFLGRITMQKGPEYFIHAAAKVLEILPDVRFIMAGSGDMYYRMIELSAHLGIGHKVLFTGFLNGEDVQKAFRQADLYIMPSVSEPFGIAPLEAVSQNVPVMISKQSGVSEVLTHALKVDFWDVNEMANKMAAVLKYPALGKTLSQNGSAEIIKFNWEDSAKECIAVYNLALSNAS